MKNTIACLPLALAAMFSSTGVMAQDGAPLKAQVANRINAMYPQLETETVRAGSVVVINPEDAHACNPAAGQPWSYRMFYVDVAWLTALQHQLGFSSNADFRAFSTTSSTALYAGLN
eukprot:gene32191-39752_t